MNKRYAFTLLEVMVAMLVFSVILVTVYKLLSSNKDRLALSANSFLAIHLSSKVMSDLAEEARLNPTYLEMFDDFPDMLSKDPVVDGHSFYFRTCKDREPPWGAIDLADGGAIIPKDGVLFEQMQPFRVSVETHRKSNGNASDPESHICETSVQIDWKEKDGMARSYRVPALQFSPLGPVPPEGLNIAEEDLLKMIREYLFPDLDGRTFDAAVGDKGCDRELAYSIGKVGVMTRILGTILGSTTSEIAQLAKKRQPLVSRPDSDLVKIQMEIARKFEFGASILYNALLELVPCIETIDNRSTSEKLIGLEFGSCSQGLKKFQSLSPQILAWLAKAGQAYEWLLQDGFVFAISERERGFAQGKALEALRLMHALKVNPSARLKDFIGREKKRVQGHDPFLEQFFLREEKHAETPASLQASLPNLKAIVDRLEGKIFPLASEVPKLIEKLQAVCP